MKKYIHSNLKTGFMKKVLFLTLWLLAGVMLHGAWAQETVDQLKSRADSLYTHYQEQQALEVYKQVLDKSPRDYTALWRTSFLMARIGNRQDSKDAKKEYFNKAKAYAGQALDVDSTDAGSNFAMAVAMGRMALISGARDRVAASRDIKNFAERALKYDPDHAGALHVLGRWHLKVANLNFAERMAANVLFGGVPKGASEEKAVEYLERAVSLKPDFILYRYDLARAYDETGQEQKAIATLNKALTLSPRTPDDPGLLQECREMLKDLK